MANGNDTRIVQMQFENKDFEQNIAKSQKSLEKFKKELNFEETSKGMDEFTKSLKNMDGFDQLSSNVQKLTDKFTGLGNVGEFVLSRIRRGLESMGDKVISFANSLTTVQAQAGFTKYESLNKAVQTLKSATGKEEKEIYGVLDRLTKYTDETSYDFSQGVTSISQLVSSGAATLGKAEKVVEGFYNMAAKAGADTQTASHALQYSWTQAMQRGYMDYSNWKELSNRSLATRDLKEALLEEAVALGKATKEGNKYYITNKKGKKVEVNTTNLWNDSLKQQWLTTEICNATMEKYADTTTEFGAQAYAAAQRCTTFTDALNAWKDMLATGWMTTYRTVFGDLGDAMQLFSGICNKVSDSLNELVETRNRIIKSWKGGGGKDSLWGMLVGEFESPDEGVFYEGRKGILDIITGTGDLIQDAFWDMVKDSMSEADKSQLELWAGNTESVMNLMAQMGMLDGASEEELAELRKWIDENFGERSLLQAYLGDQLAQATKNVQNFVEQVYGWFNAADERGVTRLEKIKTVIESVMNSIRFVGEIIGGVFDFFASLLGDEHFGPAIDSVITLLEHLGFAIIDTENNISKSGGIGEFFRNLADALSPITGFLTDAVVQLTTFFDEMIHDGGKAEGQVDRWEKIKVFFEGLGQVLRNIGQPIIDLIKDIFTALFGVETSGEDGQEHIGFFQILLGVLAPVSEILGKIIGLIGNLASGFITWGKESGFFADTWNKIKQVLKSVWDIVKTVGAPFKNFFGKIGAILKDLFTNGFDADSLTRAKESLSNAFTNLFGNLGDLIGPIREKIRAFFQKFFALFKSESQGETEGGGLFGNIVTWIKNSFGKIPETLNNLSESFKQSKSVTTFFDAIMIVLDELKQLFVKFRDHFGFTNTEAALIIATVIGAVVLIAKITKAVRKLGEGMSTLGSAVKKFSLTGGGKTENPGDRMLKIAASLAIIAAAVVVLGNMPWQQAVQGLAAMGAIVLGMSLFIKSMSKTIKNLDWKATGTMAIAMISLGFAVNKMLPAIKALSKMNPTEYEQALVGIISLLGTIALFFYSAGKLDIDFKRISGMIPLAIAIWMLIKTLSKVADLPIDKIKTMGVSLAAIMGSIVAIGVAVSKTPKGTFRDIGIMVAAMSLLVFTLKSLANVSDEQFVQMAKGFGGLIAGLLVLTLGIALINKHIGGMKDTGLKELAYAAAAMAILVFALKPIADMGDTQLLRMGAAFGGLIAGLLVLTAGLALINKNTLGIGDMGLKSLLWVAVSMFAIIMALKPVADMEWGQLGKMGAVFGGVITGLLVLVAGLRLIESKLGGGMKKSISFTALLSLVLGIVALIAVLRPIADMDWESLGKMGAAFGVLVAGIAVAVGVMQSTASGIGNAVGTILVLASLVGAISRVVKLLTPLGQMGETELIKMGASFAAIIAGMAIAMGMAAKVSKTGKKGLIGIATMLAFAAVIAVFALALKSVQGISWEQMAAFAGGISSVFAIIALAIYGLSKVDFTKGLSAIALFSVAIAAIIAVISAMAPLLGKSIGKGISNLMGELAIVRDDIADFASTMNTVSTNGLKEKIQSFVESIQLLSGATSYKEDVYSFADQIFTLGAGLSLFNYATGGIGDPDGSNAFKLLDKLITLKDSLSGMDILETAALKIAELGAGLWIFNDLGADVPEGADDTPALKLLTKLADSAEGLTAITNLPLDQLGDQLAELGGAMMLYAMGAEDMIAAQNKGQMPDASAAAEFLQQVVQQLGGEDMQVAIPSMPSEEDLADFGKELAALAGALKKFITEANGINGNTEEALAAIGFLADIRTGMKDDAIEAITYLGNKGIDTITLAKFGAEMTVLASGLSAFIKASNGITGNTQQGLDAIDFLADIRDRFQSKKIENLKFIKEFDLGGEDLTDDDFEQFGLQIEKLGEALGSFEGHVDFTPEQAAAFGSGIEALKTFVSLQNEMPKIHGLKPWLEGYAGTLGELAPDIRHLGTALKDFSDALIADAGFDAVQTEAAVNSFATIVDTFNTLVDMMATIQQMASQINPNGTGIAGNLNELYGNLLVYLGYGEFDENGSVKLLMKEGTNWLPDMFSIMSETMVKLIDSLTKADEDGNTLGALIVKFNSDMSKNLINEGLDSDKIGLVTQSVEAVAALLNGLASLKYYGAPITTYVGDVLTDVQTALQPDVAAQFDQLSDLFSRIGSGFAAITAAVDNIDKLNDVVESSMAAKMAHVMADILTAFNQYLKTDLAEVPMDQITVMTDIIYKLGNAMASLSHADTEKFQPLGEQIAAGIASGIVDENSVGQIGAAVRALFEKLGSSMAETLYYDTLNLDEMLYTAFGDLEDVDISSIMDALNGKITDAGEGEQWSFRDVGFYLAAGIAVGVSSGTYLIENACRTAVAAARAAAMSEANAHSPSLVFAQIGGWMSEGMAIGITDGQGSVEKSMAGLTDTAIDNATDALATFSSLMSQEIDANPTITPVLDMRNVESGANYINGVLGGDRDVSLSTGGGSDYAASSVPSSGRSSGEYQGTDLTGINAKLSDLGNRITTMGNKISNLQIVMDSGELVGSISGGVSSKIGRKSVYGRRRNA